VRPSHDAITWGGGGGGWEGCHGASNTKASVSVHCACTVSPVVPNSRGKGRGGARARHPSIAPALAYTENPAVGTENESEHRTRARRPVCDSPMFLPLTKSVDWSSTRMWNCAVAAGGEKGCWRHH
jgi:hypothetical protein